MTTVHALVRHHAVHRPDAVAISDGETRVSYRGLDEWSGRIAAALLEAGVAPGDRVAVAVDRSATYPAAVLGVLRAGCAYVPLDQDYPAERRAHILSDSGATAMLVSGRGAGQHPREIPVPGPAGPPTNPTVLPDVDAAAATCVIYTSGSTGTPKGVEVEHRQITSLVGNDERLHVRPGERVAQLSPLAFDASTFELWNALCRGGELVVLRRGWESIEDLGGQLRTHRPDWLFLTTGLFHLLVEYDAAALDSVGTVITGGDVLSPRHLRAAAARGSARVYAAYGPTETTTFASLHEVDPARELIRVPIGRPLVGVRMYVLDEAGAPVAAGEVGELYVAGCGVARGYVGAPELTELRFRPDPFAGEHMYRTGDLARALPDGEFEFHGRVDRQVKIRGFRVEPGEVESHLTTYPQVAAAVVAPVDDANGRKRLVGYVVPAAGADLRVKGLRGWLADRLPAHMQPSSYLIIDALPLDANGKPDRSALPYPWARRADLAELPGYRPPGNPVEHMIALAWAESLGLDQIGVDDDFYLLGGDSLHSVDVLARLRGEGLEISALSFFQNPTVKELANAVTAGSVEW